MTWSKGIFRNKDGLHFWFNGVNTSRAAKKNQEKIHLFSRFVLTDAGVGQLWLRLSRGQRNSSSLYGERPVLPRGTCLVCPQLRCALEQKPLCWTLMVTTVMGAGKTLRSRNVPPRPQNRDHDSKRELVFAHIARRQFVFFSEPVNSLVRCCVGIVTYLSLYSGLYIVT